MHNGNTPGHDGPAATEATSGGNADPSVQPATTSDDAPVQVTDGPSAPGSGEPASVHVIVTHDRTRIVVSGEIDADLGPDLQEAAADAEATGLPIEVDAQHVTFMDSSGIAFLARLASRSADRVRVLRAPDPVRFLLEVTKIGELLDLVDDAPSATPPDVPRIGAPTGGTPDDAA